jgi:hypothetical protein
MDGQERHQRGHARSTGLTLDGPHAISQAAFDAIARTLLLGSTAFENATNERGEHLVLLDRAVVDRLRALRGPGESYSDVILRVAAEGRQALGGTYAGHVETYLH